MDCSARRSGAQATLRGLCSRPPSAQSTTSLGLLCAPHIDAGSPATADLSGRLGAEASLTEALRLQSWRRLVPTRRSTAGSTARTGPATCCWACTLSAVNVALTQGLCFCACSLTGDLCLQTGSWHRLVTTMCPRRLTAGSTARTGPAMCTATLCTALDRGAARTGAARCACSFVGYTVQLTLSDAHSLHVQQAMHQVHTRSEGRICACCCSLAAAGCCRLDIAPPQNMCACAGRSSSCPTRR